MIKKINLKLIMLSVLSLCAIAALGFGSYVLYYIIPSGFQSRHAEGPKVLTELLHMAEQSKPFNPDPYIASTYRPENPLYQPVLEIQRHRWDIAEKLLEPLAEKGNADAMFWLAEITYGSPYRASRAAHLYQKSAELGNPYAALRLDVDNSDCQRFMFGYCKEKWGKLGRKLLKQRADNSDVKAAYYLLKLDMNEFSNSAEVHKKLEKLVTENAKQYYYHPLIRLIRTYLGGSSYSPYLDRNKEISTEQWKILMQFAMLAANNNFPPAVAKYIYSNDNMTPKGYLSKVIGQSILLEGKPYTCASYYNEIENKKRSNLILGGACALAVTHFEKRNFTNFDLFQSILSRKKITPLSADEINQAKTLSEKIIEEQTPVIYIDEMNSERM